MAGPSVTYTFTNGTVADASQVNQNFTDLINGLTDGTKDLNINAVTAAGKATLNGDVDLGNASGDTITINGSFAGTGGYASATQQGLVNTTTQSFAGNKTFTGFTALGTGNVPLQCKRLTGTTANSEGGNVAINHNLTSSKIVGCQALVQYTAGGSLPHGYTSSPGYLFHLQYGTTTVILTNDATSSENILSAPCQVLVWYIE